MTNDTIPRWGSWVVKVVHHGQGTPKHYSLAWAGDFDDVERSEVNVRLMAAAPDLLSCLEDLLELHEDEPTRPCVVNAREAVNRAKGIS
jgi:hypothetical protein